MASKRPAADLLPRPPSSARRVRARALIKAGLHLEVPQLGGSENMDKTTGGPASAGFSADATIQSQNESNEALFAMLLEALQTVKRLEDRIVALTQENKRLQAQFATLSQWSNHQPTWAISKLQATYDHGREVGFKAGKLDILDKLKRVIESVEFAYEVKYGTFVDCRRLVDRCDDNVGCDLSSRQYDRLRRLLAWERDSSNQTWVRRKVSPDELFTFPSPVSSKTLSRQTSKLADKFGLVHIAEFDVRGGGFEIPKAASRLLAILKHPLTEPVHLQVCGDGFRSIRHSEVLNGGLRVLRFSPTIQTGYSSLFTM